MISVIILTKNEEKHIGRCLEYIHKQTYQDFEVIIVDANSTDKTVEIVKSYGAKVIEEDEPRGFAYARNLGVKNAKGEYIAFVSADVYLTDDKTFEKALDSINQYRVDGVWGKVEFPKNPLGIYFSRAFEAPLIITTKWDFRPPRTTSFLLIKKDVFDDVGYFDETFTDGVEDQDFI